MNYSATVRIFSVQNSLYDATVAFCYCINMCAVVRTIWIKNLLDFVQSTLLFSMVKVVWSPQNRPLAFQNPKFTTFLPEPSSLSAGTWFLRQCRRPISLYGLSTYLYYDYRCVFKFICLFLPNITTIGIFIFCFLFIKRILIDDFAFTVCCQLN